MKRYKKFTNYTLEDCECKYCVHYSGERYPCKLKVCACEEEIDYAVKLFLALRDIYIGS